MTDLSMTHEVDELLADYVLAVKSGVISVTAAVQYAFEVGRSVGRLGGLREAHKLMESS